jgi:hypothetical protein
VTVLYPVTYPSAGEILGSTAYRYVTTNILTGVVQADSLPIVGESFSRQICSVGSFTGALQLTGTASNSTVASWVSAVQPWKNLLWVLQDGYPVWNGVITGWPHESILDGTLPIQAATIEGMFQHRQVSDALSWTDTDVFEIWRQLLLYGVGKTPNGQIAGSGQYANSSGIVDTVAFSGVIASVVEDASSLEMVYDCWNDLCTGYQMEYALTPAMTSDGSLYTLAQMGLPQMGRPFTETGLTFTFPSGGMTDYVWYDVASSPANREVVTGSGTATNSVSYVSVLPAGELDSELALGYPLLEDSASAPATVTSQAQINSYADGLVAANSIEAQVTPVLKMGGTSRPLARDIILGDECMFAATSPLHPARPDGSPGLQAKFRIVGWVIYPPTDQQAEQTWYQLGGLVNASLLDGGSGLGG